MYIKFLDRVSRQRVLMHLLFWMSAMVFFFFVFRSGPNPWHTLYNNVGFLPGHLLFVYSLIYMLVPRFILKGRLYASILVFTGILSVSLFYMRVADVYFVHYSGQTVLWVPGGFLRTIFSLFSIGWIAVSIKLVKYWYQEKEVQQKLEKEKLIVELQLLKSQLQPHFLFNTLNNLYLLTMERSLQAPQAVLQLSALLRYMLYECNEPVADLTKEIEMLRTYIALEQFRFRERLDISMSFTGDIDGKHIAPLLLLPFVENSIKHGTGEQLDKSWINLHLHVEGDLLEFKLINSVEERGVILAGGSGLGLQNVRRRLSLLYPGHELKITAAEDTYLVSLSLRLANGRGTGSLQSIPNQYYEAQMSVGG
jgi:sensor histidine kinase YesM